MPKLPIFSAEKVFRPMSVLLLGMITPFSPLWKAVLGFSLLPRLILKRIPYQVAAKRKPFPPSIGISSLPCATEKLLRLPSDGFWNISPSLKIFLCKKALPEHFSDNAFYVMFTESFPKGTGGKTPSPSSPHRELHPCCGCQSFPHGYPPSQIPFPSAQSYPTRPSVLPWIYSSCNLAPFTSTPPSARIRMWSPSVAMMRFTTVFPPSAS